MFSSEFKITEIVKRIEIDGKFLQRRKCTNRNISSRSKKLCRSLSNSATVQLFLFVFRQTIVFLSHFEVVHFCVEKFCS